MEYTATWLKISEGFYPDEDEEVLGQDSNGNYDIIYILNSNSKRFYTINGDKFYPICWHRIIPNI